MAKAPAPIKTSAGMETVEQTVARAKQMVSTSPNAAAPEPTAPPVSKVEAPATPVVTPTPMNTTQAIESFTTLTPEILQQQRDLKVKQGAVGGQAEDLYAGLLGLGTKGEATMKAEEAAGIGKMSTELTDIENELAQKSLSFRRERERIETQGGSLAQVNATLSDVGRKQNRELADLETIRAARSNSLINAQNLVNRKIELEFGDKIAQVNALKFIYDENKESLTKDEDRLFQQTIRREERGFEIAKQKFVQLENEKAKYLTNAAQAGADNNTLKTIQSAQDLDQLYTMPGIQNFALSQAEKLSMALQSEQLAGIREERVMRQEAAAARNAAIAAGMLLPEQAETVDGIDSQFRAEPIVKEYNTAVAKKAGVDAVLNSGVKGIQDITLVYEFMKSIDPTSVVRTEEFNNVAKSGNIFAGQMAKYNGYFAKGGGTLPENVRTSLKASMEGSFAQKEGQYYNVKSEFGEKVNRRIGIANGEEYLTSYDSAGTGTLQTNDNGDIVIPGRASNEQFFSSTQILSQ